MDWRELLMARILRLMRLLRLDRMLNIRGKSVPFSEYFKGFENVAAVRRIFGGKTEEILRNLRVELTWFRGYMWINSANGHLVASSHYLKNGNRVDIYLDIIHELVHVKQFIDGKELFDSNYNYVERPTEIEAYRAATEEAKVLGLDNKRICKYLRTEWMTDRDLQQLAKSLGINCSS